MATSPKSANKSAKPRIPLLKPSAKNGSGSPFVIDSLPKQIFLKPEVALRQAKLRPGQFVADLGCGAGYLTIPAAIAVGSRGFVYAVDILKENLEQIKSQAKLYNIPNIQTIWADLEVAGSTGIPDGQVDVTLLFKVLCQQKNHEAIFAEAVRVTKPGGLIMVAEWCEPGLPSKQVGPTKENLVSRDQLLNLAKKVGLQLEKEHKLDNFHYVLEYRRPDGTADQHHK